MHTAIYTTANSRKRKFAQDLIQGRIPEVLSFLEDKKGGHFSDARLADFIEAEARYERSGMGTAGEQALKTRSTGERKKALLQFLLRQDPDYLLLDDPFDNLDREYQEELRKNLLNLSKDIILIQLVSRAADVLPCIKAFAALQATTLTGFPDYQPESGIQVIINRLSIPPAPADSGFNRVSPTDWYLSEPSTSPTKLIEKYISGDPLVLMRNVRVQFSEKAVINSINWEINPGDFWELRGPNGSGKTTLITLITGDSPKAYGQDLHLFGRAKGSGESVWDIKEKIGYFTPAMTDRFRGHHSLENMLISGMMDSIGLYIKPTENQQALARQWLALLGLEQSSKELLSNQSYGIQRLIFCARAMIKHPPLLILDEPTAGLDDRSAQLVTELIVKMARESTTAIVFVSHREEPGLNADKLLELIPGPDGSTGKISLHR